MSVLGLDVQGFYSALQYGRKPVDLDGILTVGRLGLVKLCEIVSVRAVSLAR